MPNLCTALIMIDIQNDYWMPPRLPRNQFLATAAALLDHARSDGCTVIHVQHASRKSDSTTFRPGTPGYELHPSVAAAPGEARIVKHTPGAFFDTDLDAMLRAADIDTVMICGMQTQKCCDTTTREASARGYRPLFVADAVETFDLVAPNGETIDRDEINRVTFATLANGFATVVTLDELRRRP